MSRPAKSASPIILAALIGLVLLGAALLGFGTWSLLSDEETDSATSPTADPEPDPAAPAETKTNTDATTTTEPTTEPVPTDQSESESDNGSRSETVDEDLIDRAEQSPEILVRGNTDQGWTIESPDEFGFYPIGGAGPDTFTDNTSTGFAQTPEGAGLAAIHILQRVRPINPEWRTTADEQLVGVGVAAFVASTEALIADEDTLNAVLGASALKNAWVGWNVIAFDPQVAELRLAGIGSIDGNELRFTLDVRLEWLDNDWRVVSTATDGSDLSAVARVTDHGLLDLDMRSAFAL